MADLTIPVLDMTCNGCASSVKRVLEALPGLEEATVSLAERQVVVRHDPAQVGPAAMVEVIEGAGFTVPVAWQTEHAPV